MAGVYHKIYLPNYGVFDEDRYFQSGTEFLVFELNGTAIGVNICEDIWYPGDPTRTQCLQGGAQLIVNISSSPYHAGKMHFRQRMLATRAWDYSAIVAYVNLVGGQDELVFDGGSMVLDQSGELLCLRPDFRRGPAGGGPGPGAGPSASTSRPAAEKGEAGSANRRKAETHPPLALEKSAERSPSCKTSGFPGAGWKKFTGRWFWGQGIMSEKMDSKKWSSA